MFVSKLNFLEKSHHVSHNYFKYKEAYCKVLHGIFSNWCHDFVTSTQKYLPENSEVCKCKCLLAVLKVNYSCLNLIYFHQRRAKNVQKTTTTEFYILKSV